MIPRDLFLNEKTLVKAVESEGQVFYITDHIDFYSIGGIRQYIKGAQYPQKGLASPEILASLNIAKRVFVGLIKLSQKWVFLPSLLLIGVIPHFMRVRAIQGILEVFNSISGRILEDVYLKTEHMLESSKEIYFLTHNFLYAYGISEIESTRTARVIGAFIEFDNAYRYRLQDLFHSTTKEKMISKPVKEVNRLIKLSKERDSEGVSEKFVGVLRILSIFLLLPSFRKAFKTAIESSSFHNLQFDESDIYYISMRNDYDYLGEDVEVRSKRNNGKTIPVPISKEECERLRGKGQQTVVMVPQEHWKKIESFLSDNNFKL